MDDYYVIEWRYCNPDAMLFNYWRRHGAYYGGGRITDQFTEDQLRDQLPLILNDKIEVKVIRVTHDDVDYRRFL